MTQTTTTSPEDTGEIRLVDDGGATQNLAPYAEGFRPMRRPAVNEELWDTAQFRIPQTIGIVEPFEPPAGPPPPNPMPVPAGPHPRLDLAAAQPLWPLERVGTQTERLTLLESLGGQPVLLRKSVPYVKPQDRPEWTGPKHRRPSLLATAWARIRGAM